MENYKLVLPEHLNQGGFLFGGNLLKWVDETSWIAASLDFPGCNFVTVAMDKVEFHQSVRQGTILKFDIRKNHKGTTSVQYRTEVFCEDLETGCKKPVFSTLITFVSVDEKGEKKAIPREAP